MNLLDGNTSDSPVVSDCTACFRKPWRDSAWDTWGWGCHRGHPSCHSPWRCFNPKDPRTQQKVCCRHTELSQLTSIPDAPEIIKLSHQIQYWIRIFQGLFSGISQGLHMHLRWQPCQDYFPVVPHDAHAFGHSFKVARKLESGIGLRCLQRFPAARDGEPWFMLWSSLRKNHHLVLSTWWSWISVKLGWRPNTWQQKNIASSLLDFAQSKSNIVK